MSSQAQKRKHKTLTIKEKSDILDRINLNESLTSLANEYGVGRSTIYDIKKNHEKIRNFVSSNNYRSDSRQTLKKSGYPQVEKALYKWFLQERNRHTPISGAMLASKAKFFYNKITKKDDFVASKGWLERFKRRHAIRLVNNTEETDTSIESFKLNFLQKVKDLDLNPSQVYNAVRSGLFWRVIPNETFVSYNDKSVPRRSVSKERVTILPCCNAAGTHALKMTVIGKYKNPRSFKNIDLPVHYYGEKYALLTKDLLKKWFDECFVPEVRKWLSDNDLPQKALLILDDAPVRLSEEELTTEDKCITVMFLPPNCAALQPIDQHIIQLVKQDYKKNLLLIAVSKDQPILKTLKEFNMKDLVFSLFQSWNALPPSSITLSWKKLWPDIIIPDENINVPLELIDKVAAETQMTSEDLETWYLGMDEKENAFHKITDDEILDQISSSTTTTSKHGNENDDDINANAVQVTEQDAINAFEVGLQWAEENGASYNELLILRKLRDRALVTRSNSI